MKNSQQLLDSLTNNAEKAIKQWNLNEDSIKTKITWIDNFLSEDYVNELYKHFPNNLNIWHQQSSLRERKKDFNKIDEINEIYNKFFTSIQSNDAIKIIEKITNIPNLKADTSLYAGGMSKMDLGDFLNPHIDNSHNAERNKYRRLNLLYYITPDWRKEYGGNFEIWDQKVKTRKEIISNFNRLVIMETNNQSWHSVNKVTVNNSRCCLSTYLYTDDSPSDKEYYHVTSFNGRPEQKLRRYYHTFDNFLRQKISTIFKISRGKKLKREV